MTLPILSGDIGFTGTINGITLKQKDVLHSLLRSSPLITKFHHGDDKGADKDAAFLAKGLGFYIVGHPPENPYRRYYFDNHETKEVKPFLDRNQDIVNESKVLIACPDGNNELLRSGTWATVRRARIKGIPIIIIYPDGRVEVE